MGVMLEKSRLADDLLDVVGHLAGGLRGGMALGIIGVGVLMGATTGIVGATVITLGLITLPTLLKRGYDPGIACGAICASGTLGQIIPPSLILILLADILQLSVGTLFAAAVMPGMLLAALYCVYIVIVGMVKPDLVPPLPQEERDALAQARPVDPLREGRGAARAARASRCWARSSAASRRPPRRPRWARSARSS